MYNKEDENKKISRAILLIRLENYLLNKELDFNNAEVYDHGNEIEVSVEAPNHTTMKIYITNEEAAQLTYGEYESFMENKLNESVENFDIDEEFDALWSREFGEHNGFTVRQFIEILEEGKKYFEEIYN